MRSQVFLLTLIVTCLNASSIAAAQADDRAGKQVVDEICAACHGAGGNGAPRIGDADAWKPLIARGLASLTTSAINGVRKMRAHGGAPTQWRPSSAHEQWRVGDMPPRGGNGTLSDVEIGRAITYMVNMSGGDWTEPAPRQGVAQ